MTRDDDGLRVPPHSAPAEQHVLGALMLDAQAFDRVADVLREEDFYVLHHRLAWRAIAGQSAARMPCDVVTVFDAVRAMPGGGEVELAYLNATAQAVMSSANVRRHAEIVREKSLRRQLIAAASDALEVAWGDGAVGEKLDAITATFGRIERSRHRKAPQQLGEPIARALDRYDDLAAGRYSAGWSTGVPPLDRVLSRGLKRGKVYCVAARPSVGKSSLARHMALRLARDGHPTLLLSQEMPVDEVTDCIVSAVGRIDNTRLQTGALTDDDWSRLADAADEAARLPMWVDDEGSLTIAQMRAKARGLKGIEALVLDYLQLSASTLRNATTNDQVAEISKGLKALALELDIPVVVLSQLNRDVEKRADKEPQMADLRDSGAIEQDCDVAVMLWTARDSSPADPTRLVGCKVAKHRGGPKGKFALRFDPAIYAWHESAEPLDKGKPAADKGFE